MRFLLLDNPYGNAFYSASALQHFRREFGRGRDESA
jgi:hypothetical protein